MGMYLPRQGENEFILYDHHIVIRFGDKEDLS